MKRVNWITGGRASINWAYRNNCENLISKLHDYSHEIDLNIDVCKIVVFFDILLMQKQIHNFPKAKKILRLGGQRPFDILTKNKIPVHKITNKADCIVSVNNSLLDNITVKTQKIYVIPNSIDLSVFNSNDYIKPDNFIMGFSGNVSTADQKIWKGYNLVLDSAKDLDIPLKLALRGELEIPHKDMVKKFYHKISCLIHPSISEGCSNVVGEALACGIPVVMHTDGSFHFDKMTQGQNIVFCDRSVFNIKNCISFVQNHWEVLSSGGQKFIKENQDLDIISKQWDEVLKKL